MGSGPWLESDGFSPVLSPRRNDMVSSFHQDEMMVSRPFPKHGMMAFRPNGEPRLLFFHQTDTPFAAAAAAAEEEVKEEEVSLSLIHI